MARTTTTVFCPECGCKAEQVAEQMSYKRKKITYDIELEEGEADVIFVNILTRKRNGETATKKHILETR